MDMKLISAGLTLASLLLVTIFGPHKSTKVSECDSVHTVLRQRNHKFLKDYKHFTDSLITIVEIHNMELKDHVKKQLKNKK